MAENTNGGAPAQSPAQTPADSAGAPQLAVNAQYMKDFSFESPNAPQSLVPGQAQPQIAVNVDVQARGVAPDMFEVSIRLNAEAKQGDKQAFLVELVYGGLFTIKNIPAENLELVCLIECPRILFPFARRIVADATRDGGFPPLMLDPIDFAQLYQRSRAQQAQAPTTVS